MQPTTVFTQCVLSYERIKHAQPAVASDLAMDSSMFLYMQYVFSKKKQKQKQKDQKKNFQLKEQTQ